MTLKSNSLVSFLSTLGGHFNLLKIRQLKSLYFSVLLIFMQQQQTEKVLKSATVNSSLNAQARQDPLRVRSLC